MALLRIALGQFDVHAGDPDHNVERVRQIAATAAAGGAGLLVLPEMWATGYDLAHNARHVPRDGSPHLEIIRELARHYGMAIAGSLLTRRAGHYYNTATLVSAQGDVLLEYDKLHLFTPMDEHHYLQPGELSGAAVRVVDWLGGGQSATALAVCYDLRFPELFRHYMGEAAGLVIIPAEWPRPRITHWRLLLQARAVENLSFVVGVNRSGQSDGTIFGGHSLVCDPWGEVLTEAGEGEETLLVDIDLALVAEVRARFPALANRRPDLWPAPQPTLAGTRMA